MTARGDSKMTVPIAVTGKHQKKGGDNPKIRTQSHTYGIVVPEHQLRAPAEYLTKKTGTTKGQVNLFRFKKILSKLT